MKIKTIIVCGVLIILFTIGCTSIPYNDSSSRDRSWIRNSHKVIERYNATIEPSRRDGIELTDFVYGWNSAVGKNNYVKNFSIDSGNRNIRGGIVSCGYQQIVVSPTDLKGEKLFLELNHNGASRSGSLLNSSKLPDNTDDKTYRAIMVYDAAYHTEKYDTQNAVYTHTYE